MLLPAILRDYDWYRKSITFPTEFGIYTIFIIVNLTITVFVMVKYAIGFIKRAVANYWDFKVMNMETLIALGCVSAFALFVFFIIKYTFAYLND